jgi:nucleoside 2-deoxyribosyltransferase/Zn ribbon nucleic-acid-binding protein
VLQVRELIKTTLAMNKCPVCSYSATLKKSKLNSALCVEVICLRCGFFSLTELAIQTANKIDKEVRWKCASYVRHNCQNICISDDIIKSIEGIIEPSLLVKARFALRFFAKNATMGSSFETSVDMFVGWSIENQVNRESFFNNDLGTLTWSKDSAALKFLIEQVLETELQWIAKVNPSSTRQFITPKGWLALESIPSTLSQIGFCAMWFNDEVKSLWTGCIKPAILSAGYEPLRIDGKQHNNKIDDEIIASIRQAKFVVSDLTGNRGGVYYEAGFAHGLGLPVIFMCRRSDDDKPHFDIQQYNTIFWSDDEEVRGKTGALSKVEARKALQMRIESTMGKGTYAPSK